jgi:protoporphyrinogen oxidase
MTRSRRTFDTGAGGGHAAGVTHDAVILGAGPAGLGAALALARSGARVALIEAAGAVGGMCRTLGRAGARYDLGGHVLFVHDDDRRRWLEDLLGPDLVWVARPVSCVRDGAIAPGRYLDQRPERAAGDGSWGRSARDYLAGRFGDAFVDATMRRYLEKVDGMPLERITAARARKLMVEQYAPEGFWYPAHGIGQLMEAMADAVRALGGDVLLGTRVRRIQVRDGRVGSVDADGSDGPLVLRAPRVIAGLPPALVASLVDPAPAEPANTSLPPRAAAVVVCAVDGERLTDEAWIQVDDPRVPFARLFEAPNWSRRLVREGMSIVGGECYCAPTPDDPSWGLDDAALGAACARALADPLGLVDDPERVRPIDVIRLPRAWSLVDVDALEAAAEPARLLADVEGLRIAQGGDIVLAIASGEDAARAT